MWKIISLSALLIVAKAADIQDFYGDWIEVAFYPVSTYIPLCIRFSFSKNPENVQCTYDDGRNVTTLDVSILTQAGDLVKGHRIPLRVVDTPAEVMPALNISVKCGDKVAKVSDRAVVRLVNEEYFILYSHIPASKEYTRSEVEQNSAMLFGRKVVSAEKLNSVMMSIEDLKNRRGAHKCVTENYSKYKSFTEIVNE